MTDESACVEVKMSRLFVVSVMKDAQGKREPRQLTTENYNIDGDFDWSPDGRSIAFSHTRSPIANDWTTSDVSMVEVSSGKVSPFLKTAAAENSPRFSPDGKSVAAVVSDIPVRWARTGLINIFSVTGDGTPKVLVAFHVRVGVFVYRQTAGCMLYEKNANAFF